MGLKVKKTNVKGAYAIEDIEGIGPAYAAKLAAADITTTSDLLALCCDRKGRETTAEVTGVSAPVLLKWVNMADLMRISGIGSEYSELLEVAGVDTVKELKHRNPENLAVALAEANEGRNLTRRVPNAKVVAGWIEQAKTLSAMISH